MWRDLEIDIPELFGAQELDRFSAHVSIVRARDRNLGLEPDVDIIDLEALRLQLERERAARMVVERREARASWAARQRARARERLATTERRCKRCRRALALNLHSYHQKDHCGRLCWEEATGRRVVRCRRCSKRIEPGANGERIYCSNRCKVQAHYHRHNVRAVVVCADCPSTFLQVPNRARCAECQKKHDRARRRAKKKIARIERRAA